MAPFSLELTLLTDELQIRHDTTGKEVVDKTAEIHVIQIKETQIIT